RQIEFFRARIDRPEALIVEKDAVGEAMQHGAFESQGSRALELVGGSFGHGGGERRQSGKARPVSRGDFLQPVAFAPSISLSRNGPRSLSRVYCSPGRPASPPVKVFSSSSSQ